MVFRSVALGAGALAAVLATGLADSSPFAWDTVLDMSYSFCFNSSGPYR